MFPINPSQTPRGNRQDFPRVHIAIDETLPATKKKTTTK